jgi:tRNA pseudouridine38-40 synthase
MTRLRLIVEYDGSEFQGWQRQKQGRSVQGVLEQALLQVTGEARALVAAGRTDAGVHATGQTAHCDCDTRLSPLELRRALNATLPADVSVAALERAAPGFHARSDACAKRYVYTILNRAAPSPTRRRFSWHLRGALDRERMAAAAAPLLGEHDFAAYRGARGGAPADESTLRRVDRLELVWCPDELRIVAEGPSFLRYMVRNLVGTLVEVGQGRRAPESPARVLEGRERALAGPTAPPHGLCLERVWYGPHAPAGER